MRIQPLSKRAEYIPYTNHPQMGWIKFWQNHIQDRLGSVPEEQVPAILAEFYKTGRIYHNTIYYYSSDPGYYRTVGRDENGNVLNEYYDDSKIIDA